MTSATPPAAAIFLAADPLNLCACTVSAFAMSPRPSTLTGPVASRTRPRSRSSSGVTGTPGLEHLGQRVQVHDRVLDAKRVVKPALRHAPMERHLTAFEPALEPEARPRLRALAAARRRLAVTGSRTAADALLRMLGALRGGRRLFSDMPRDSSLRLASYCSSTFTRCRTFRISPRVDWRVLDLDRVADPAQAQAAQAPASASCRSQCRCEAASPSATSMSSRSSLFTAPARP